MKIRLGLVSNSSSDSFICKKDMTPERARELLDKIISLYCEISGEELTYENVFAEPYITDEAFLYGDRQGRYPMPTKGKLIIDSISDNSIPYAIQLFIEEAFDARRVHLG